MPVSSHDRFDPAPGGRFGYPPVVGGHHQAVKRGCFQGIFNYPLNERPSAKHGEAFARETGGSPSGGDHSQDFDFLFAHFLIPKDQKYSRLVCHSHLNGNPVYIAFSA
jgi:hypothetical protein